MWAACEPDRRSPHAARGYVCAAVWLLLVAAAFLGESLFGGRVLCQADALFQFEPWRSVAPPAHTPANPLLLDQSTVMLPWLHFAAAQVRAGELPLWNPDNYAGHPVAAAASGGLFFPLHWPFYAWPSWRWLAWFGLVKLAGSGLFALLFLRLLGLGAAAAALGAQCFMLSGFAVAWLGHPHAGVAMFLPALFWIAERDAQRPSARNAALLGLCVGLQLLGGHLQTFLHVQLAAGAFALWRARTTPRPLAYLLRYAAGIALGLALGAPQLLPFAEYLRESQAATLFADIDAASPVRLRDAAAFLVEPGLFGAPHTGDYTGPLGHNLNYSELVGAYTGKVALVLAAAAALGARRARRARFFVVLAALALLVAWQVQPFYAAARALPVLGSTKLLRLLLLAAFALSVLAAHGFERLLAAAALGTRARAALSAACLAAAGAELFHAGYGYNPAIAPELVAPRTAVTDFLKSVDHPYRVLAVDNTSLIAGANLFYGIPSLTGYDSLEYRRTAELVAELARDPLGGLRELFLSVPPERRPRVGFIKEIRTFDRLEALPLASLLNVEFLLSTGALPPPLELVLDGSLRVYRNPGVLPRAFAASAVRRFAGTDELLRHLGSADFDPRVAALDAAAPPELELPALRPGEVAGQVHVARLEPRHVTLELELPAPRLIVLADAWAPGWEAELDGRPVEIARVDHALRGVLAPAGRSRIEMRYAPLSVRLGLWTAAVGALIALGLLLRRGSREADTP